MADTTAPAAPKEKKPYVPPPPPEGKEVLVSVRGVDKIFTKGGETVYALHNINLDIYRTPSAGSPSPLWAPASFPISGASTSGTSSSRTT